MTAGIGAFPESDNGSKSEVRNASILDVDAHTNYTEGGALWRNARSGAYGLYAYSGGSLIVEDVERCPSTRRA